MLMMRALIAARPAAPAAAAAFRSPLCAQSGMHALARQRPLPGLLRKLSLARSRAPAAAAAGGGRRGLASSVAPLSSATRPPSQPPFIVRTALVGVATGLCTPLFATGGVVLAWYRVIPQSMPWLKLPIMLCLAGGIGTISYRYVLPFLWDHGELVLPFAVANAATAAFWYAVVEYRIGLAMMAGQLSSAHLRDFRSVPFVESIIKAAMRWSETTAPGPVPPRRKLAQITGHLSVPLGGPLVGLLTAATAGLLWPPLAAALWPENLRKLISGPRGVEGMGWLVDLHLQLLFPLSLPIGIMAGYGLHVGLAPFLLGTIHHGVTPWQMTSIPLLCAMLGAGAVYFSRFRTAEADLYWESRINIHTGEDYLHNVQTGESRAMSPGAMPPESMLPSLSIRKLQGFGRWLQYPLRVVLPSVFGDLPPEPKPHLGGSTNPSLPVAALPEHQAVHIVFDMLVRLKKLQLSDQTFQVKQQQLALRKQANQFLGLDIVELLSKYELITMAMQKSAEAKSDHDEVKLGLLMDEISKEAADNVLTTERGDKWSSYQSGRRKGGAGQQNLDEHEASSLGTPGDSWITVILGTGRNHELVRLIVDHFDDLGSRFENEIQYKAHEEEENAFKLDVHVREKARKKFWQQAEPVVYSFLSAALCIACAII